MATYNVTNTSSFLAAIAVATTGDIIDISGTVGPLNDATVPSNVFVTGTPGASTIQMALDGSDRCFTLNYSPGCIVDSIIHSCPGAGEANESTFQGGNNPTNLLSFDQLVFVPSGNVTFNHCVFKDRVRELVRMQGNNILFYHCLFNGGYYAAYTNQAGTADNIKFRYCTFTYTYEGIKNVSGGPNAKPWTDSTKTPDIEECNFFKCGRDALDITKGWRNLWVRGGIWWEGTVDLKSIWLNDGDENGVEVCWDVRIEDVHFVHPGWKRTLATMTLLQKADPNWMTGTGSVTPAGGEYGAGATTGLSDWLYWGPREIEFRNCIVELEPGTTLANNIELFAYKAGRDLTLTNTEYRGGLENANVFSELRDQRDNSGDLTQDDGVPPALIGYDPNITVTGSTFTAATSPQITFPTYNQSDDPAAPDPGTESRVQVFFAEVEFRPT